MERWCHGEGEICRGGGGSEVWRHGWAKIYRGREVERCLAMARLRAVGGSLERWRGGWMER